MAILGGFSRKNKELSGQMKKRIVGTKHALEVE
jgi:hypothetical protein